MATIKSYTDLYQSKVLSKILPLESADMLYYCSKESNTLISEGPFTRSFKETNTFSYVTCWSLAALFSVLPNGTDIVKEEADTENEEYMCTVGVKDDIISTFDNNPVDACVAMIEKLHELKML